MLFFLNIELISVMYNIFEIFEIFLPCNVTSEHDLELDDVYEITCLHRLSVAFHYLCLSFVLVYSYDGVLSYCPVIKGNFNQFQT